MAHLTVEPGGQNNGMLRKQPSPALSAYPESAVTNARFASLRPIECVRSIVSADTERESHRGKPGLPQIRLTEYVANIN